MAKTRIFLSSTCYDLRAVREHIRSRVLALGHELLASEFPSFPVAPDLTTVENCKQVVRDHADLLVLVVGGKRGSMDPVGGRSVVNAEYLEARSSGIECFVFVDRQVWNLGPIYDKNETADFSSVVDHNDVFKFIRELKRESRWIFTFERTEEIIETLTTQLSIYLRTLIHRGRKGVLALPSELAALPLTCRNLIQEQPPYWQQLLSCELIEGSLARANRRLEDISKGMAFRPCESLNLHDAWGRINQLLTDMMNLCAPLDAIVREIPPTWNPPGGSDPVEVKKACARLEVIIDGLVGWEEELRFVAVPEDLQSMLDALRGSTSGYLVQLARIPREIRELIAAAKANPEIREGTINLVLLPPPQIRAFGTEMERLKRKFGA